MTEWYLYLSKREWATAWVDGGNIPIAPAAKYVGGETAGTQTPDELVQVDAFHVDPEAANALRASFVGGPTGVIFDGVTVVLPDGRESVINGHVRLATEETIILSFSRLCERRLMRLLKDDAGNPKEAIVRITDPQALLDDLSAQLGIQGRCEHFNYTRSASRSHYLKGWNDRHMAEIRLFWPMSPATERWVTLRPGMADLVDLDTVPEVDPKEAALDFGWYDRSFEPQLVGGGVLADIPPQMLVQHLNARAPALDARSQTGETRADRRRRVKQQRKAARKMR